MGWRVPPADGFGSLTLVHLVEPLLQERARCAAEPLFGVPYLAPATVGGRRGPTERCAGRRSSPRPGSWCAGAGRPPPAWPTSRRARVVRTADVYHFRTKDELMAATLAAGGPRGAGATGGGRGSPPRPPGQALPCRAPLARGGVGRRLGAVDRRRGEGLRSATMRVTSPTSTAAGWPPSRRSSPTPARRCVHGAGAVRVGRADHGPSPATACSSCGPARPAPASGSWPAGRGAVARSWASRSAPADRHSAGGGSGGSGRLRWRGRLGRRGRGLDRALRPRVQADEAGHDGHQEQLSEQGLEGPIALSTSVAGVRSPKPSVVRTTKLSTRSRRRSGPGSGRRTDAR